MEIFHEDNGKKGKVFILREETVIAEMTYVWAGDARIIIDHTLVDESLKGQGVGKQLLDKLAMIARERQLSVFPLCTFAKAMMEKTTAYEDLLTQ